MFALRGIAVSLTFFVLLYCLLSTLVAIVWRSLKLMQRDGTEPGRSALRIAGSSAGGFCQLYR